MAVDVVGGYCMLDPCKWQGFFLCVLITVLLPVYLCLILSQSALCLIQNRNTSLQQWYPLGLCTHFKQVWALLIYRMWVFSSYSYYMHEVVFSVLLFTLDTFLCFVLSEIMDSIKAHAVFMAVQCEWMTSCCSPSETFWLQWCKESFGGV